MPISQSEFAREMGVSRQRISALISAGKIPKLPDGRVDPAKARVAYAKLETRVQGGKVTGGARVQLGQDEKILDHEERKRKADADLAELKVAKLDGSLIDAEKVARLFEAMTTLVREALRNRDSRLATRLVGQDLHTIRRLIAADSDSILEQFVTTFARGQP